MIFVYALSGEELQIALSQQATTRELKTAIKHLTGIKVRNQQIIVDGSVTKSRDVLGHGQVDLVVCSLKCVCGNDAIKLCGGCTEAGYCSRVCQRRDWKLHKGTCHGRAGGSDSSSGE